MFLPSKFKFKYILWFLVVLLVFPAFKDIFVSFFVTAARNVQSGSRSNDRAGRAQAEAVRLARELERLKNMAEENEKLKKALAVKEKSDAELVYARVVGFSPSVWRRIAYISAGSSRGVVQDDLVIDEQGMLLGKVLSAEEHSSQVVLLNDPYFSLPVFIRDKGMGLLQGRLGGVLQVLYVEADQGVEPGDVVRALSRGSFFSVEVGTIKRVREKGDDFFLDVRVSPSARVHTAREVFIFK